MANSAFACSRGDGGVFEERPGVSNLRGVRQFGLANADDGLAHISVRAFRLWKVLELLLDRAVAHPERAFPVQMKGHPNEDPLALLFPFEHAFTVPKGAILCRESLQGTI